ncbi:hypothetical protein [Paraburkholderia dinghuensis]|uniref:hypothetical protein n=1 Tax=Paraburkholderia dinghuensis TaxID=2305225 RepID=UPI00162785CC|nr:hypothetical protein [Paraburkholderia dinghuensis]
MPGPLAGDGAKPVVWIGWIARHLAGTLLRPDVDLHSFNPVRTWFCLHSAVQQQMGWPVSGGPVIRHAFHSISLTFTWENPFMNEPRTLWQVVVDEARICLREYFLPLVIAWRWLRRVTRR